MRVRLCVPRVRMPVMRVWDRAHGAENTEPGQAMPTATAPGPAQAFGILGWEMSLSPADTNPEISVVVPVCNEAENVAPLAREIAQALRGRARFEVLFVDDGSTDGTAAAVREARSQGLTELRLLRHSMRRGQSAAVWSGVRAARAPWIATLDGDGQNDPADIPALIAARDDAANRDVLIFMGNRVTRRDTWLRRLSSRIANAVRAGLLGDGTPDTGCGIKLLERETYLSLPMFDHMHRFLPALYQRAGSRVVSVPVNHRPRTRGQSKYGLWNRLWVGIVDIFGVMWLQRRFRAGLQVREE
jgi:dolichol-phosphate mannosyltransferase